MLLPAADADELALHRALFAADPDGLLLVGADGHIQFANPAAQRLLGYAPGELTGLAIDALVPAALRASHATLRQTYAGAPHARPMGTQMDLRALRKDGSELVVEIALSPLSYLGRPCVVATMRAIDAYPRVLQVMQRARYSDHLAQLGRLAADGRDPQAVLERVPAIAADALRADAAWVYLFDADRLDFRLAAGVGLPPGDAVGARLANRPDSLPGLVLLHGRPLRVPELRKEIRFAVPPAWLQAGLHMVQALPVSDRGRTIGAIVVGMREAAPFGDDELHFVESLCNLLATCLQRAQSEDALKHAQRLETLGQLTGGIAHDFNNLLTIIQGSLQVLEELPALADDTQGQQLVAAAARASRRGAELTGKLLAFSRRQVLQPGAVDVSQMLLSLADMLRRTLDQRIRILVDAPASCPPVLADPGQLEAALLNIAINARDAMLEGGTLQFRARSCDQLPGELRNNLDDPSAREQGYVLLCVSDTGCGMSEDIKQHAFEPFFTTKEAGRGTGLGLSTVYGFVKQSRGAVTIDSLPGAGTTMSLYLPRPGPRAGAAGGADAVARRLPEGLRVLLVEDDADVRRVVRAFLEHLRCRVTVASSAEQALLALSPLADFDLLLSDIALGAGMRGTQLAALAQQQLPRLAVLLMSGYSSELLQADRDAPASWELLRKPYTRDQLAAAMARLIAARED